MIRDCLRLAAIRTFALLFLAITELASAQATPLPQVSKAGNEMCPPIDDYKVLTRNAVAIHCDHDFTRIPDSAGKLILANKNGQGNQVIAAVQVVRSEESPRWLILYWALRDETSLTPGKNYIFDLQYDEEVPPADRPHGRRPPDGTHPDKSPSLIIPIDTSETATLSSPQASEPLEFLVTSHIAFAVVANTPSLVQKPRTKTPYALWPTCKIPSTNALGTPYALEARCSPLKSPLSSNPTLSELNKLDLNDVGYEWIRLKSLSVAPKIPVNMPIADVLGGKLKFDKKSRFARQNAPATKDASQVYINVNYQAGAGTVPGWVLDSKYAVPITMYGQFTLAPSILADIGNNTVGGHTYTNTIDLGGTASRVFRPGGTLQLLEFSPGVTYETDKQFDRDNLLATIDSHLFFRGLYNTQQQQALRLYSLLLKTDEDKQLSDVPVPSVGYQLDFHAGLEAGGSLIDTTVHASKGSAAELLPQYSIFRLVPQVHVLYQLWRFSFDESFVGRYLATDENTIVETPSHSLYLHTERGWKGISTLTSCFALDSQGNFNATVTFKDGLAPPDYQRVNGVQAGILIKY